MEMADEKWKIAGDLCRCCLAVGTHNKLGIAKFNKASGDNEDFANMLLEHLGLTVLPVKCVLSEITYTICNPCVERLRDAVSFRKQVQLSEEKFWNMYGRNMLIAAEPIVVKIEEVEPEDTYKGVSDDDFNMDDFSDDDTKLNFVEIKAETKKGKAKAGTKGAATKKPATRKMAARKTKTKTMMDAGSVKAQKQKVKTEKADTIKTEEKEEEGAPAEKTKPTVKRKKGIRKGKDYAIKDNKYVCKHCEHLCPKLSHMRRHVLSEHLSTPVTKQEKVQGNTCPTCQMTFDTEAPFTAHKLEAHNIDDRCHCKACGAAFNSKSGYVRHMNTFHMLGKRFKCKFCDYECYNASGLYKHSFKHKTAKDYHCRFCKKSFLRKTTLHYHERIHTGDKRKMCEVCQQAFVQKASLNYHMAKYHPGVPF